MSKLICGSIHLYQNTHTHFKKLFFTNALGTLVGTGVEMKQRMDVIFW